MLREEGSMRYVKAFLLILIFFVTMIFLFQNQASLSQKLAFQLDLLVMPSMTSIELPFYFVLLAAFLLGALLCLLLLLWDRMRLSAQIVRANWRVQAMQNEERKLLAQMERLATLPREGRLKLLSHFMKDKDKKNDAQEQAEAKPEVNEFFADNTPDAMEAAQATDAGKKNAAK